MTSNRKARRAWAAALRKHVRPGAVLHVEFRHDPDCAIYTQTRLCSCDPDRVLKDHSGRTLAHVEGAGPYSPFEMVEGVQ